MLSNEVFALQCRAWYEEQGLVVDASNGEFAHCPQPERYGDAGYYLLWEHHQHQGLLQSRDIDECCFFVGHAKKWLTECDYFPDDYFELWDIYDVYASAHNRKNNEIIYAEKDELGRSVRGIEAAKRTNAEKDESGKSIVWVKIAEKIHAEKDELGRSVHAMKTNSQLWESTVDGFRSTAGPVAYHNKANGWDPNARRRVY